MEIITAFVLLIYALWYLPVWLGNKRIKTEDKDDFSSLASVPCAVIIPFYNNAATLPKLFNTLAKLNPPPKEIILIDDYSEDDSYEIAVQLAKLDETIRVVKNQSNKGKKQALSTGILMAREEIILCSDSDCFYHPLWVQNMFMSHTTSQRNMTLGLVEYINNGNWLSYYQWLESRALMSVGSGMFNLGMPLMCNGANLMFNRTNWKALNGYEEKIDINTGDDIFLMHDFWILDRKKVGVCYDENTIVYTNTTNGFRAFMKQRKRWASKIGKYKLASANFYPLGVGLINMLILACFVLLIVQEYYSIAAILLLLRAAIDYFTIASLNKGFSTCVSFVMVVQYQLFQLIYPFFLPFYKSDWKKR